MVPQSTSLVDDGPIVPFFLMMTTEQSAFHGLPSVLDSAYHHGSETGGAN
jgi:hypothetical protein